MQGLSNAIATAIYQHLFGDVPYTAPATLYVALAKGPVSESDDGSTFDEADYTGYARVPITNNLTNFPAPLNGAGSNGIDITFPQSTGGTNTIQEVIFLDSGTIGAGTIIGGGSLTTPNVLVSGEQLVINATEFEITVI